MREFNFTRVSDIIGLSMEQLEMAFGTHARFIYEAVRGIDPSPVRPAGQNSPVVTASPYNFALRCVHYFEKPQIATG
ncbi:MAG TPA: hypothetical protein PKV75_07130 [Desulfobacterales bacterium]|nr:hypothetical protein [Desulfobacterales bacterium]